MLPRFRLVPRWLDAVSAVALLVALPRSGSGAEPPPPAPPRDSLTVLECARRAMAVAPEVLAAREEAQAARLDARAAARNRRPEVGLHSGLLVAPKGFYDPAITNLGEYDLKLVGTVPLADGGTRRREQLRTRAVAASVAQDLEATRRDAGLRAAELGVRVLRSAARIERHEAGVQWTTRVLESIRSGARSGARSTADVVRLELEQQGLEADLEADRRDRAALTRELALLLGAPDTSSVPVRASAADRAHPETADSAALFARVDTSAEILRARSDVALAELELAAAHHRTSLQVDLTADAGFAGTDLTHWGPPELAPDRGSFADRLRKDAGASVALDLRRPLIQPGAAFTVDAREASVTAARLRLERVRQDARRTVSDLLGQWAYAARDLPDLLASVRQAESNLLHAQSLYVAGALPLLDLLDARRTLRDAQDRAEDVLGQLELARAQAEIRR